MASEPATTKSRGSSFWGRLLSTLGMWGVVAVAFFSGELWALAALAAVLAALGSIELFRLTRELPGRGCRLWALVVSLVLLGGLVWETAAGRLPSAGFLPEMLAVVAVVLGAFGLRLRHGIRGPESVYPVAMALLALVYVPILFGTFTIRLAALPSGVAGLADPGRSGIWLAFLVVLSAKFTDMGAYLVGSLVGRHKAIPHISPAKSWEGYFGSLFFAQGGALGVYYLGVHSGAENAFAWVGSVWQVVLLAFLVGLAAMVGDLAESVMKRSLKVKDSGKVLPGIGGVLDLVDSLCFAVPVAFFYCHLIINVL